MTNKKKKSTIISESTVKPKSSKESHYVDNEKLYDALKKRKESGQEEISNYIAQQIMLISENLSMKHHFRNYPFREDMVMDGVVNCIKYINNFDHEKYKNPFAYFTQICYYAFIGRIESEKTSMYVKFKSSTNAIAEGEVADLSHGCNEVTESLMRSLDVPQEHMNDFITEFEDKKFKKKKQKSSEKKKKGNDLSEFF